MMAIVKGWSFGKNLGYTGSASADKVQVRAHERAAQGFAKGGAVKSSKPQKHYDRMENFRKERDSEPSPPSSSESGMAKGGKWIAGAIKKPGALHKQLGVSQGEKIPAKKLEAASKKGGKEGKRARLAQTLGRMHKAEGGKIKGDRPIIDRDDSEPVSKALAKSHKLNRPGGDGTKNIVGFKKGGKARIKSGGKSGGDTAKKAAGALAQIASMVSQSKPGGASPFGTDASVGQPSSLGAPSGPPLAGLPSGFSGGPLGGPPGMKKGGSARTSRRKKR